MRTSISRRHQNWQQQGHVAAHSPQPSDIDTRSEMPTQCSRSHVMISPHWWTDQLKTNWFGCGCSTMCVQQMLVGIRHFGLSHSFSLDCVWFCGSGAARAEYGSYLTQSNYFECVCVCDTWDEMLDERMCDMCMKWKAIGNTWCIDFHWFWL